jgi:hypothetical protein
MPPAASANVTARGRSTSAPSGQQVGSSSTTGPGPSAPALDGQTVTELENELDQLDNSLNEASSDLSNP